MALSTAQLSLIEQRVANDSPSTGVAYLLWLFVGILSGHRFYLGRPGTAILQILTYFILIGFIWLLVDAFLIPGMIRQKKDGIRQRMTTELLAHSGTADASI
ncbi:MAG TPA: TM2 domain-containing protein [Allosphingosinicella sp.]|nr:TM2 domain-containing protein [Allosphingosinicella sp.]